MSIDISHSFEYLNGEVDIHLRQNHVNVTYTPRSASPIIITDASGEIDDWRHLYRNEWADLSGAALESAQRKHAQEYAIAEIAHYISFITEQLKNE